MTKKGIVNITDIRNNIMHAETFGGKKAQIKKVTLKELNKTKDVNKVDGGSIVQIMY